MSGAQPPDPAILPAPPVPPRPPGAGWVAAPHRPPRRGALVAALVVAVVLLVGSVGATVAWAHADARAPFGIARLGTPGSGHGWTPRREPSGPQQRTLPEGPGHRTPPERPGRPSLSPSPSAAG